MPEVITNNLDLWSSALLTKSTAGRGSNGKLEAYGIKKLRTLILELAVRGKLVPQDHNDEPASVLLNRIQVERAKLIAEGKLKIDKPLPPIAENEKPFELPKGWVWCRFGVLVNICTGKLDANAANENGQYPFFTCSQTPSKIDTFSFDTAAVLLAGNGDFNVKFYQGKFDTYQRTYVIEPVVFGLKFCYLLVLAQIEAITKNNRGSAIPYLKIGDLTEPVFALPPLPEQHRIVAKVDELMALCDQLEQQQTHSIAAHQTLVETLLGTLTGIESQQEFSAAWARIANHFDTLFTTEASIDQLKQTILKLAVMGKLVPQNPSDESASELLKRYKIASATSFAIGWSKVSLGALGDIYSGATPSKAKPEYWVGNIPWISPKDMKRFYIDDAEDKVSENAIRETALKLIPAGSLLIVVRGMILAHSFPVALTTSEVTINQDMKALVVPGEIKDYLLLYMRAMKNSFVSLVDRSSHGTCKLISEKLWSAMVAIPPLAEQHRIVAKVDELMALCDTLKARIKDAQAIQLHLADAIVEQAVS